MHAWYCINAEFGVEKEMGNGSNQCSPLSTQRNFAFTGRFGNVWRDIWFSHLGEGGVLAAGVSGVGTRGAAQHHTKP